MRPIRVGGGRPHRVVPDRVERSG